MVKKRVKRAAALALAVATTIGGHCLLHHRLGF